MNRARHALILAAVAASAAFMTNANADPHGRGHERFERHREGYHFDNRFHHDHYYPAPGYRIGALPRGHVIVRYRDAPWYFHGGVWYRSVGPRFVVARPPVGIVVPVLPPAYTMVWVAGVPYYYANDVYYAAAPGGYVVAAPPAAEPSVAPPPPTPAPPQSGTWYYCESSQAYYPYVSECKEGWKSVPAAPPGAH